MALDPETPPREPAWAGGGASDAGGEPPWLGLVAGGVWLVYLTPAAGQVVTGDWPLGQRVAGGVLLVAFVGLYLTTLAVVIPARRARSARQHGLEPRPGAPGDREMQLRVGGLLAIGLGSALAFGGEWLTTLAFVAAIVGIALDRPWAPRAIVTIAVVCEVLLLVRGTDGDGSFFWLGFAVLVAGFVSYAARRRGELESELLAAREQNARFAVVDERNRIARDLHDLLGHSLSVIAVKSQLAERLLDRDDRDGAATEIRDVRGVARDALREVRHVVDGYRHRPLTAELASCAAALRSAAIDVRTTSPGHPLAQVVEDVVSFVVREGTTNVLRHSGASRCRLAVHADAERVTAVVEDDGRSSVAHRVVATDRSETRPGGGGGHGLRGLAERLAAVGGTLEIGPGDAGGTALRATVPTPAGSPFRAVDRSPEDAPDPAPDGPADPAPDGAADPAPVGAAGPTPDRTTR